MRELGDIYMNNAELVYNQDKDVYRLYVTEMTRGVFILEFSHILGQTDIIIQQIYFI